MPLLNTRAFTRLISTSTLRTSHFIPGQGVSEPVLHRAPLQQPTPNQNVKDPKTYKVQFKYGTDPTLITKHRETIIEAQLEASNFAGIDTASQAYDYGIHQTFDDTQNKLWGYKGKFTTDVLEYIRAQPEVEWVQHDDSPLTDPVTFSKTSF